MAKWADRKDSYAEAGRLPTCPEAVPARRRVLQAALVVGAASLSGAAGLSLAQDAAAPPRPRGPRPTPDQILGPFYPVQKPIDGGTDLTQLKGKAAAAKGEVIYVLGRVLNMKGEPVVGAQLEVWQANGVGRYNHPSDWNTAPLDPNFEGYATVTSDSEGRYRFKTIKPGAYPVGGNWVRPPHIHFDVKGNVNRLITQMYFENEPLNEKDMLLQGSWAKDSLIAKVLPPTQKEEQDSRLVVFDIVLIQG